MSTDALIAYRRELLAATARWQVASRRRRRRLALASAAFGAMVAIGGTAVAATGWLVGAPAPPSVKSDFGSYATQLGFNPKPGKAVLVASDPPYQLYATTNKQGTYCVLVSAPWKRPGPHGEGGDCVPAQTAAMTYWAGTGGMASEPGNHFQVVFDGRTTNPKATSVRFATPDGRTVTVPIGSSGFFITGAEIQADPCTPWTPVFSFLDRDGNEVGKATWQIFGACVTATKSRSHGWHVVIRSHPPR
jgi:hypothetical protein